MANTALASYKSDFIEITFAGNGAAWDITTDTNIPAEIRNLGYVFVDSITFVPSAANDKCVITEGAGSGGPKIFEVLSIQATSGVVTDVTKSYRGKKMCPYFDLSLSTLSTPASAKILIELA